MRSPFGNPQAVAREIGCRFRQGTDKNVSGPKFGAVARAVWPENTDAHLASIANVSVRTAARWLSGEFEPPGIVIAAVVVEITRRS